FPVLNWIGAALPGFGLASLAALGLRLRNSKYDPQVTRSLLAACGLVPIAGVAAFSAIDLTAAVHPATFDLYLYRFDRSLGFDASATVAMVFRAVPPVAAVANFAYDILPYGLAVVFAFQISRRLETPASMMLVWWVSGALAWALYHVVPATGPQYVFGNLFPYLLPLDVPAIGTVVAPAPRNAM